MLAAERENAVPTADADDKSALGEDNTHGAGIRLRGRCHTRHEQRRQGQLNNPS
jgi:hypothetical protein